MVIGKLPHVKLPAPLSRKTVPNKLPPGLDFGFGLGFGSRAIFCGGGGGGGGAIFRGGNFPSTERFMFLYSVNDL